MRRDGSTNPEDGERERVGPDETPEFDAFLAAIGYGHYFRDAPAERQDTEPLRPETRAGPRCELAPAAPRRRRGGVAAAVAAVGLLCAVTWPVAYNALRQRAWRDPIPEPSHACVAFPVLGLGALQAVRPGMTPMEVRDLAGLPQYRVSATNSPPGEVWLYPAPLDSPHFPNTQYGIRFVDGRVLRVAHVTDLRSNFGKLPWSECPARHVGDVDLILDNGRVQPLREDEKRPAVLISPSCPPDLHRLPAPEGRLIRLPQAPDGGPDPAGDWVGITRSFPLSVYYRGFLVHIPPLGAGISHEATRGDVEWLLGQLGRP